MQERRIRLRDGRRLGVAERGVPDGRPLLWFPGTPGSRLAGPLDDDATRALGIRLIAVERPGFGWSDFQPGRRVVDWPADVAELCDALGLARVAIAGASGAGPYLLTCAHRIPERLSAVGLIACAGPVDAPGATAGLSAFRRAVLAAAARSARLVELAARAAGLGDAERLMRRMTADAPACDRALLARPDVWAHQVAMTAEALRPGLRGFAWELALVSRPWGFSLADIAIEVMLWHGEQDAATPIAMARHAARTLPRSRARFFPGSGHFLHFERWAEIAGELMPRP